MTDRLTTAKEARTALERIAALTESTLVRGDLHYGLGQIAREIADTVATLDAALKQEGTTLSDEFTSQTIGDSKAHIIIEPDGSMTIEGDVTINSATPQPEGGEANQTDSHAVDSAHNTAPRQPSPADGADVAELIARINCVTRFTYAHNLYAEAASTLTAQAERIAELERERDAWRAAAHNNLADDLSARLRAGKADRAQAERIAELEKRERDAATLLAFGANQTDQMYQRAATAEAKFARLQAGKEE